MYLTYKQFQQMVKGQKVACYFNVQLSLTFRINKLSQGERKTVVV